MSFSQYPQNPVIGQEYTVGNMVVTWDGTKFVSVPPPFGELKSIGSVDELRTFAGRVDGQQVSLTGYYAGSAKGGGILVWDASSTAADDGGVTFAVNGVATGRWVRQLDGFVTPEMFGTWGDGTGDDTAQLKNCFEFGGKIRTARATYLIAAAGDNAGGCYCNLTKSVDVECHPETVFKAGNGLDHDLIRLWVTSDIPEKITVKWSGGTIDQRLQKVSTSVPFSANYPPANQGLSATTDGLSIVGIYNNGGIVKQYIKKCTVSGVTFNSSDGSWQTAGGDSGLNIASESDTVYDCDFFGCRDLGIYHSSDSVGGVGLGLAKSFKAYANRFHRCMFGVTSKRGADRVAIYGNTFDMCIQAIASEPFDKRSQCWSVFGNTIDGYIWAIDIGSTDGVSVTGNTILNAGVLLDGGVVPTVNFTNPQAVTLRGCVDGTITGNTISGKLPEFSALSCEAFVLESQDTGGGSIDTDDCLITSNTIKNVDVPVSGQLLNNDFTLNKVKGTNNDTWNMASSRLINKSGGEVTISAGAITVTNSMHNIDTEANAATDDLDTINGGVENMRLILKANTTGRVVVLKDGVGNLALNGDFSLTNQSDFIELIYNSDRAPFWYELSRSDNG